MGVKVVKDRSKEVMARINDLVKLRVMVGVPGETTIRESEADNSQPINNATLAYLMENGAPAANIPARPFLVPGIEDVVDEIGRRYERGGVAVLDGKLEADQVHHAVGLIASAAVKRKITEGPFAPLAAATLERRRAKGNDSDKPLIDTGQLRQAITYVIRRPRQR